MDFASLDPPQPIIGSDGAEPGFWAHAAYENPWSRGRRNSFLNGSTLYQLRQNVLHREPGLRESRANFDGRRFYRAVGNKTENLEALLAQSTGPQVTPGEECDSCQKKRGPFVSCVIAPGIFNECANCHWSQQGRRCSFNSQPPDSIVLGHRSASAEIDTACTTELGRDLDTELRETRLALDEAMSLVHRLNRRFEEILEAKARDTTNMVMNIND